MELPLLFVIGDSISMNYGPYLETFGRSVFRYARKTGTELPDMDPYAAQEGNGGDSAMVIAYLQAMRGRLRADVLLLNCGLHDLKSDLVTGEKQVPLVQYAQNLRTILDLAREAAVRIAWVRTTPVDDALHAKRGCDFARFNRDVEAYNAVADPIMREEGVPIIDLYTFTNNLPEELFEDGVHFTKPVVALQAAYIMGALASLCAVEELA